MELGAHSDQAHLGLIPHIIDAGIDVVFTLGEGSKVMGKSGAISVSHFDLKARLNEALRDEVKPGDVVLIKGSRGMKMEECITFLKEHYGH